MNRWVYERMVLVPDGVDSTCVCMHCWSCGTIEYRRGSLQMFPPARPPARASVGRVGLSVVSVVVVAWTFLWTEVDRSVRFELLDGGSANRTYSLRTGSI